MAEHDLVFDEETKACVHQLLENFWITRADQLEQYVKIRECEVQLRKFFEEKFRWRLHVNKDLAKLEKIPVAPEPWMGISSFRERLDYVLFCCLLSFLESKQPGEQFLLTTLCEDVLLSLNELQPDVVRWTDQNHRRSFARVLKYAESLGLLNVEEGNVLEFGADENQEALFTITPLYLYFLRRTAKEIKTYSHFSEFLQEEGLTEYQRLFRHLFLSPIVHRTEMRLEEQFFVENLRRTIGETIADTTHFELEVYREAALLVSIERPVTQQFFPDTKGISTVLMHLAHLIYGKVSEIGEWAPDSEGVTMQSILPFLLDGNKSPKRLDPFNSNDRRMHDYLCGERELNNVEDRIGYLFLEYKKADGQYMTTGVGLQAKAGTKDVDFWGFVVTNNQRVNKGDLCVYEQLSATNSKVPLTKKQLIRLFKERECGTVVTGQKEYMELVNRHLFQFENLDTYQHLIKLLVLLRSPKLSKDFKVHDMHEILTQSLPELTQEELLPFTETIENLDQLEDRIKQYERSQASVGVLDHSYQKYNRFLLSQKARSYLEARSFFTKTAQKSQKLQLQIAEADRELASLAEELQKLSVERNSLNEQRRILQKNEVFSLQEQYENLLRNMEEIAGKIGQTEREREKKRQFETNHRNALKAQEDKLHETEKEIRSTEQELVQCAFESSFADHALELEKFRSGLQNDQFSFTFWKQCAQSYRTKLREIVSKSQAEQAAKQVYQNKTDEIARDTEYLHTKKEERSQDWNSFELSVENFLDAFHRWVTENQELKMQDDERDRVHQMALGLYETVEFDEIRSIVDEVYERRYRALSQRIADLSNEQKEQKIKRDLLQRELQEWMDEKDPVPTRHPEITAARTALTNDGIPYMPFYAAVDFHDEVPSPVRNRLEHAMLEIGMLDALLVGSQHQERAKISDKVLVPGIRQSGTTLSAYLTPVANQHLSAVEIEAILHSILVDGEQGEFRLSVDGHYKSGILEGSAPDFGDSIFIGQAARERYRKQKIADLKQQISLLDHELKRLKLAEEVFAEALRKAREEKTHFPSEKDMKTAHSKWKTACEYVTQLERSLAQKAEQAQELKSKWQQFVKELLALTEHLSLDKQPQAYQTALEFQEDYLDYLNELERLHQKLLALRVNAKTFVSMLEEAVEDFKRLTQTVSGFRSEHDSHQMSAESLRVLLEERGLDSLRKQIATIEQRLHELPDQIETKTKRQGKLESDLIQSEAQFETTAKKLHFYEQFAAAWQEVFIKESALGFVEEVEQVKNFSGDTAALAESVCEQIELSDVSLDQMKNDLFTAFYEEKDHLLGYHLERDEVELVFPVRIEAYGDEGAAKLKELHEGSKRFLITLELEDRKVSPRALHQFFQGRIEMTKQELTEKERELFREILMNNIGEVIRQKINKVVDWVDQMGELMEQRKNTGSNGFKVYIKWKPKADMKTSEGASIIELLLKDPKLLEETDLEKIATHFSAKIDKAKLLLQDERKDKVLRTLQQIVRETLDYRQWFEFVMDCRKGEEPLQELTQKKFNKLSGGEKAMAMYIPLFTAVYSRYLDAGDDAPHIITLDEAFAGVDHHNISKMFALVEELGFDYVMNSQILWGDYEAVSALSIYELIQPPGTTLVALEKYTWDGQTLMKRQDDVSA